MRYQAGFISNVCLLVTLLFVLQPAYSIGGRPAGAHGGSAAPYPMLKAIGHPLSNPRDGDLEFGDEFGSSIALTVLGPQPHGAPRQFALVGAPGDNTAIREGSGSAYLYHKANSGWVFQGYLFPFPPYADGDFGVAVAFDRELPIVGAPNTRVQGEVFGVVHLFNGSAGAAGRFLRAPPQFGNDPGFGKKLQVQGDRLVVGAAERVYVFARQQGAWIFEAALEPPGDMPGGLEFASTFSLDGDLIAVAATRKTGGSAGEVVYLFRKVGAQWVRDGRIDVPQGAEGASWGEAVVVLEGLLAVYDNGFGIPGAPSRGRVHMYQRSGEQWLRTEIVALESQAQVFPWRIALYRDAQLEIRLLAANSVGEMELFGIRQFRWTRLLRRNATESPLSLPWQDFDPLAVQRGVVLNSVLRSRVGLVHHVPEVQSFVVSDSAIESNGSLPQFVAPGFSGFGQEMVVHENLAIVAMPEEISRTGYIHGAVYVFKIVDGASTLVQRITHPTGMGGRFGSSLLIDGDELLIGSTGEDPLRGQVFRYRLEFGKWVKFASIDAPGQRDEFFGEVMALHGDRLVVGGERFTGSVERTYPMSFYRRQGMEWLHEETVMLRGVGSYMEVAMAMGPDVLFWTGFGTSSSFTGPVRMITRQNEGWVETGALQSPEPGRSEFGYALDYKDGWLAVGSPKADGVGDIVEQGAVHLYQWNGSNLVHRQRLVPVTPRSGGGFGSAVKFADHKLLVGVELSYYAADGRPELELISAFDRRGDEWLADFTIKGVVPPNKFPVRSNIGIGDGFVLYAAPRTPGLASGNLREGVVWAMFDLVKVETIVARPHGHLSPGFQLVRRGGYVMRKIVTSPGYQLNQLAADNCDIRRIGQAEVLIGPVYKDCQTDARFSLIQSAQ